MYSITPCICPEILQPLADEAEQGTNSEDFAFEVKAENIMAEMRRLILSPGSMVLLLFKDGEVIGCMGLEIFTNPFSGKRMANERCWFVLKKHRGIASLRLFKAAEQIARKEGCSHFIFNASKLASDSHDKVVKLYEKLGMKHWETSFICQL